ncbi:MAG: FecCD family ABC transporter permease [Anaerovoracaceae bacterium]|jgi:iron complex transport system permease protein
MTKEQKQNLDSKIQMHIDAEERNVFRDERNRRYHMEHRTRILVTLALIMIAVYCCTIILPSGLDSNNENISLSWWSDTLQGTIRDLARLLGGQQPVYMQMVTCRYVIVGLVGAALAITGAVYQGALKNGLASPTTLGVQTGGVLGGSIYVLFFMTTTTGITNYSDTHAKMMEMNIFQRYEESFFILIGCFTAVIFVVSVARMAGRGKISTVTLILTGLILSSVVGGVLGLIRYWLLMYDTYGSKTYELRFMMMGTFSRTFTFQHMLLVGTPILIGIVIVMMLRSRLNLLTFGEDEARAMGIRVELTRNIMIAVVTVLTAVVISFCGMIGFIGFIVPHITRRFTGPDFRYLVPGSALVGASVMMIIYYIATVVNYADNINLMTSLVGGTIFLVMLVRFRSRSNADWA